jgi:MFS family permease
LKSQKVLAGVFNVYLIEALLGLSANLILIGLFFYTSQQFGWAIYRNLLLAAGEGVFYVFGALSAGPISRRLGRRRLLVILQAVLAGLCLAGLYQPTPIAVSVLALFYAGASAAQWPLLESLASTGASGHLLSRRLTAYNLVWSGANAITVALCGTIIQHWPAGLFVVAVAGHAAAAVVLWLTAARTDRGIPAAAAQGGAHIDPEPELLKVRTQALWLARIALPSAYIITSSLSAMLPSLAILQPLDTQMRTLLGSVWFMARCLTFIVLGLTVFWHTRPRLMVLATLCMLLGFLGTTIRLSDVLPGTHVDLLSMILCQILLGASMGMIYSASLYFGMVLSQGSTDHGGYHEALIGLGGALGPTAAAAAHLVQPNGIGLSIAAVAGLIGVSLMAVSVISIAVHRR